MDTDIQPFNCEEVNKFFTDWISVSLNDLEGRQNELKELINSTMISYTGKLVTSELTEQIRKEMLSIVRTFCEKHSDLLLEKIEFVNQKGNVNINLRVKQKTVKLGILRNFHPLLLSELRNHVPFKKTLNPDMSAYFERMQDSFKACGTALSKIQKVMK